MNYKVITSHCWQCKRQVKFPAGAYKDGMPVFCCTKCNRMYVAEQGESQKRDLYEKWQPQH